MAIERQRNRAGPPEWSVQNVLFQANFIRKHSQCQQVFVFARFCEGGEGSNRTASADAETGIPESNLPTTTTITKRANRTSLCCNHNAPYSSQWCMHCARLAQLSVCGGWLAPAFAHKSLQLRHLSCGRAPSEQNRRTNNERKQLTQTNERTFCVGHDHPPPHFPMITNQLARSLQP